jgi:hypothetical protein
MSIKWTHLYCLFISMHLCICFSFYVFYVAFILFIPFLLFTSPVF